MSRPGDADNTPDAAHDPAARINGIADDLLGELRRGGKGTLKEILIRLDRPTSHRAQVTASRAMHVLRDRGEVKGGRAAGTGPIPVWEAVAEPPKEANRIKTPLAGLDATVVVATLHRKYPVARVEIRAEVTFGASWPTGTRVPGLTLGLTLTQAAAPGTLAATEARAVDVQRGRVAALRGVPNPAPAPAVPAPVAPPPRRLRRPPPPEPARLPSTRTPIPEAPPMSYATLASIPQHLRRELLAYAATVQGGARSETLHSWLRTKKVERVPAEELLDEMVAARQLERIELVVAGTDVVRYKPADPSTKPAPLPRSDAPEAPAVSPAPPSVPSEGPGVPSASPPAAVPPAPAAAPTPTEPVEEPVLNDPPLPVNGEASNLNEGSPNLNAEASAGQISSTDAPGGAVLSAPPPASDRKPTVTPPAPPTPPEPYANLTAPPGGPVLTAAAALAAYRALPRQVRALIAEADQHHEQLDAEDRQLDQEQGEIDRQRAEIEALLRQLATRQLGLEGRRRIVAEERAKIERRLAEAMPADPLARAASAPSAPPPTPRAPLVARAPEPPPSPAPAALSKAPLPPPKPLAKAPAQPANDSDRPVAERVLLALQAGEKVRASDVASRLRTTNQHAISSALSALFSKELVERVEFGVYRLTKEGAAEQRRLRQRSAA
jgi:hypothetical protein